MPYLSSAFAIRRPHDLRHGFGQHGVAVLTEALVVRELTLGGPAQLLRLARDDAASLMQLDEHRHLAAQDFRVDRLQNIVYRADGIRARHQTLVAMNRGQKNDRHRARLFSTADQLSDLVTVEHRHLHVEQDQRKLVAQQIT